MSRQPGIDIQGQLYHIIARGIERIKIFLNAGDYRDFITCLKTALKKTDGKCMAWCLMPDHFHLLILRGSRPLSEFMRRVMTGYAVGFNSRRSRLIVSFQRLS